MVGGSRREDALCTPRERCVHMFVQPQSYGNTRHRVEAATHSDKAPSNAKGRDAPQRDSTRQPFPIYRAAPCKFGTARTLIRPSTALPPVKLGDLPRAP